MMTTMMMMSTRRNRFSPLSLWIFKQLEKRKKKYENATMICNDERKKRVYYDLGELENLRYDDVCVNIFFRI